MGIGFFVLLSGKCGFPKIRGTLFGSPYNKDYSILGSLLGPHYFGKLPNQAKFPKSHS